jgi:hypothetical protein
LARLGWTEKVTTLATELLRAGRCETFDDVMAAVLASAVLQIFECAAGGQFDEEVGFEGVGGGGGSVGGGGGGHCGATELLRAGRCETFDDVMAAVLASAEGRSHPALGPDSPFATFGPSAGWLRPSAEASTAAITSSKVSQRPNGASSTPDALESDLLVKLSASCALEDLQENLLRW